MPKQQSECRHDLNQVTAWSPAVELQGYRQSAWLFRDCRPCELRTRALTPSTGRDVATFHHSSNVPVTVDKHWFSDHSLYCDIYHTEGICCQGLKLLTCYRPIHNNLKPLSLTVSLRSGFRISFNELNLNPRYFLNSSPKKSCVICLGLLSSHFTKFLQYGSAGSCTYHPKNQ